MKRNVIVAVTGALSAIVILMGIPGIHLGYIQISPAVSLTIMHIPVILAAVFAGYTGAAVTGLVFGLTSLVNAAINPSGVLDPLFLNPLCSVLPRLLFGLSAAFLTKVLALIPRMPKYVNTAVTAFVSSLIHSFLVIGSMYLFLSERMTAAMNGLGYLAIMLILLNGVILESIAASIVCTAVMSSITVVKGRKSKLGAEISKLSDGAMQDEAESSNGSEDLSASEVSDVTSGAESAGKDGEAKESE